MSVVEVNGPDKGLRCRIVEGSFPAIRRDRVHRVSKMTLVAFSQV